MFSCHLHQYNTRGAFPLHSKFVALSHFPLAELAHILILLSSLVPSSSSEFLEEVGITDVLFSS
jgi:hypothetical protein